MESIERIFDNEKLFDLQKCYQLYKKDCILSAKLFTKDNTIFLFS